MEKTKPNTTKARIHQSNETCYNTKLTQKLKPGLVASYDIRCGNGGGLFWFRRFTNLSLTYLLRYLPTYLQPWDPHGAIFLLNMRQQGVPWSWVVNDAAKVIFLIIHSFLYRHKVITSEAVTPTCSSLGFCRVSPGACLNLQSASLVISPKLAKRFKHMSSFDC